ncbi:hypothetical protein HMPREF3214_01056 [Alloscardovia omnicolens]|nr:hypothetical protein HMPREF3214_01056 [Alloscardovia omnicolens]
MGGSWGVRRQFWVLLELFSCSLTDSYIQYATCEAIFVHKTGIRGA